MKIKTAEDVQEMLRILSAPSKMNAVEYAKVLKKAALLLNNISAHGNAAEEKINIDTNYDDR